LLRTQGVSPASRAELMSGCAGAGREPSQTARPSWPMEIFYLPYMCTIFTISMYHSCHAQLVKAGFAGGRNPFLKTKMLLSLSCGGLNFSRRLVFFPEFGKLYGFCEFGEISEICELGETVGFRYCCSGTGCQSVIGQ